MRVVLDTNVVVSGLLSSTGPPAWIVEAVLAGELEPVFDSAIRLEYEEVLARPEFDLPAERVSDILAALDLFGFRVVALMPWPLPLPDPDDGPFLAAASLTASTLVTGNLRHFPGHARRGVAVLTPREFIDRVRSDGP